MDPYLEHPAWWRGLHTGLVFCMTEDLNSTLPEGFGAVIYERLYVVQPGSAIYPDVALLQSMTRQPRPHGMVATAGPDAPSGVVVAAPEEIHEAYIEIRTARTRSRVVAVIEVLSPTNKAPNSVGRDEYVKKQREALSSDASLLEIDLLRTGLHTAAVPRVLLEPFGAWDYLVCLHRGDRPHTFEFWLNSLRDRLPCVSVPLGDGVPDAVLNLQSAFDRAYDAGPYSRMADYSADPPISLSPADAEWAHDLLTEHGLRPPSGDSVGL
jgi:hypothetical protein